MLKIYNFNCVLMYMDVQKPRYLDEMQGIVLWAGNPVYKAVHG